MRNFGLTNRSLVNLSEWCVWVHYTPSPFVASCQGAVGEAFAANNSLRSLEKSGSSVMFALQTNKIRVK